MSDNEDNLSISSCDSDEVSLDIERHNDKKQLLIGDMKSPEPQFDGVVFTKRKKIAKRQLKENEHEFLFKWTTFAFSSAPNIKDFITTYMLDSNGKINNPIFFHEQPMKSQVIRLFGDLDCERRYIPKGVSDLDIIRDVVKLVEKALVVLIDYTDMPDDKEVKIADSSMLRWTSASNDKKLSYHFVLLGKLFKNLEDQQRFWSAVRSRILEAKNSDYNNLYYTNSDKERKCILDFQAYNTEHPMRTIYSSKHDDTSRVLKPKKVIPFNIVSEDAEIKCCIEDIENMTKVEDIQEYFILCDVDDDEKADKSMFYKFNKHVAKIKKPTKTLNYELIGDKTAAQQIESLCSSGQILDGYVLIGEPKPGKFSLRTAGGVCPIKKAPHKSNGGYCCVGRDGIYFRCYDDDCKGKKFKVVDCECKATDAEKKAERKTKKMQRQQEAHDSLTAEEKAYVAMIRDDMKGLAAEIERKYVDKFIAGSEGMRVYNDKSCLWMEATQPAAQGLLRDFAVELIDKVELPADHVEYHERRKLRKSLNSCHGGRDMTAAMREHIHSNLREWSQISNNDNSKLLLPIANNKVVNLRTGEIIDRQPSHYLDWTLDITPNNAKRDVIERYMLSIMNGRPHLVRFLQKVLGYILTGDQSACCMFIFLGPGGSNGKSSLINAIDGFLGKLCQPLAKDAIFESKVESAHQANLIQHKCARLSLVSELKGNEKFKEDIFKAWTSGDPLPARNAGQASSGNDKFRPPSKILIATNHMPETNFSDHAMERRMIIIPFDCRFVATQAEVDEDPAHRKLRDQRLVDDFTNAKEALLDWMLEGAKRYYVEGFTDAPEEVVRIKNEIKKEQDSVASFIEGMIEFTASEKDRLKLSEIRTKYFAYCRRATKTPLKDKQFNETFSERVKTNCVKYTPGNIASFKKIKFKEEDQDDSSNNNDVISLAGTTEPML